MSDVDFVAAALPRLMEQLRARSWVAAGGGGAVTEHQMRILRNLDDVDPVMVGELADFLGVTASTMSLNLKKLESSGWITRRRDPEDRRAMNVLLTPEGRRLRDGAPVLDPGRVDAMLVAMRPQDRERALAGLGLLASAASRLEVDHQRYVQALAGDGPPTALDP